MKNLLATARVVLCVAVLLMTPALFAQATRTWVSGVGDDANPCSRTAPCKTFAGAISKTAAGGEINVLDPGGFGALTITKSITVDGSGGSIGGALASGTNGFNIIAGVNDVVTLRNLDINGNNSTTATSGVRIASAKAVHIENSVIYGFRNGITIETSGTTSVAVRRTTLRNNANAGIYSDPGVVGSAVLSITDSHLDQNNFSGLHLVSDTKGAITGTTFNQNTTAGIIAESATINVGLKDCTISGNNYGIAAGAVGAAVVRISGCLITANNFGISFTNGATVVSFGNNSIAGNPSGLNAPSSNIGQQ